MASEVDQHPQPTLEQVRQNALMLPLEDREALTIAIIESVEAEHADIDRAWLDEVRRRIVRYQRGESTLIDHDEVMHIVDEDLAKSDQGG